MSTHAEVAAELLTDAAEFFKTLAAQNAPIRNDMMNNAAIYERMAELLVQDPTGSAPTGQTYGSLAGQLLNDTANFFRKLATENPVIKDQMEENATIYKQVGNSVAQNPTGIMD